MNKANLKPYSSSGAALASVVGQWTNELGSVMTITAQDGSGLITGTYQSAVSGSGGAATGQLTGFVNGDTIGWVVDWTPAFHSVTSWAGQILVTAATPALYGLWYLARDLEGDQSDWWEGFLAGADLFLWTGSAPEA